jgi:hypothetical protein
MGYNVWDTIARLTYTRHCVASVINKSMGYNDSIPSGILDRLSSISHLMSAPNPRVLRVRSMIDLLFFPYLVGC